MKKFTATEIRNPAGNLVAKLFRESDVLEIKYKGWVTRIEYTAAGDPKITHIKVPE